MMQTNQVRTTIQSPANAQKAHPVLEVVQSSSGQPENINASQTKNTPTLSHEEAVQQAILRTG